MGKFVVMGGNKLTGSCSINGMKNSAVALFMASIVVGDVCVFENVPQIEDIETAKRILTYLGAKVDSFENDVVCIDTKNVTPRDVPDMLMRSMRASYYLAGAMFARFGYFSITFPGGCNIGKRPIDQHLKAFEALGATITVNNDRITGIMKKNDSTVDFCFDVYTVGGTINALIASSIGNRKVKLKHVAKEPYINDVANFLNSCGAEIVGAGTDEITVCSKGKLHSTKYRIMPDYIEAGTFIAATAVTHGRIVLTDISMDILTPIITVFQKMGMVILPENNGIVVDGTKIIHNIKIETNPYPGFPTDLQPLVTAMMCYGYGDGEVRENVFENRFLYANELAKMGADLSVSHNTISIHGDRKMNGAIMNAVDLRAGASLVIAALGTKETSEINDAYHVLRGYPNFSNKLKNLGAVIDYIN